MFLKEANLKDIVYKQTRYKLNSNISSFLTLMFIQIIGLLLSFGGTRNSGSSNGQITINTIGISSEIPIILTFICIVAMALIITTKRNIDFTLVSSPLSSGVSNVLYLIVICAYGAITSAFLDGFLHVLIYLTNDRAKISEEGFKIPLTEVVTLLASLFLYLILLAAIAYLIGILLQLHRSLIVIIPAVIISIFIYEIRMKGGFFSHLATFFTNEASLPSFAIKVLFTSALLFGISLLISRKLEVRK